MAISDITISKVRQKVIDYLYPHWEDAFLIFINLSSNKWSYFTEVFNWLTWIAIVSLPVLTAMIIVLMTITNTWIRLGQNTDQTEDQMVDQTDHQIYDQIPGSKRICLVERLCTLWDYTYLCFSRLLMQGN